MLHWYSPKSSNSKERNERKREKSHESASKYSILLILILLINKGVEPDQIDGEWSWINLWNIDLIVCQCWRENNKHCSISECDIFFSSPSQSLIKVGHSSMFQKASSKLELLILLDIYNLFFSLSDFFRLTHNFKALPPWCAEYIPECNSVITRSASNRDKHLIRGPPVRSTV